MEGVMAKFCSKCGTDIAENIKFCPKCGARTNKISLEKNVKDAINATDTGRNNPMPNNRQDFGQQPQYNQQAPVQKNNDIVKFVIAGVVLAVLIVFGMYSLVFKDEGNKPVASQAAQSVQQEKNNTESRSAPADTDNKYKEKIAELANQKDQLDVEIGGVAASINSYLNNGHADFRDASADKILNDAKATLDKVEAAQKQLKELKVKSEDQAVKDALLSVYDCEAGRIRGLYKGVLDSRNNGEYSIGFGEGTKAAYKFDDENKKFNDLYKK